MPLDLGKHMHYCCQGVARSCVQQAAQSGGGYAHAAAVVPSRHFSRRFWAAAVLSGTLSSSIVWLIAGRASWEVGCFHGIS